MPSLEAQKAFQTVFGVSIPKGPTSSVSPVPTPAPPAQGAIAKVKSAIASAPAAVKSAVGLLSPEKAAEIESIQATGNPIKRAAKTALLGAETVKDVGAATLRAPIRLATQIVRDAGTVPGVLSGETEGRAGEYTPQGAFAKFFLGTEPIGKSGSTGEQLAEGGSEVALRNLAPAIADLPASDPKRFAAKMGIGVPLALVGGVLEGMDAELPGIGTAGKKAAKVAVKKIGKEAAEEAAQKIAKEGVEAVAGQAAKSSAAPAVKAAAKALPEEIGTFAPSIGKAVHPEDAQVMEAFIDNVRLKGPDNPQLVLDATRIAEGYGMKMPRTEAGLANVFDDVLSGMRAQAKFDSAQMSFAKGGMSKMPTQAYGAVAGFTPERDENGNISGISYDPKMGLVGVAGLSAAQSGPGKKLIGELTQKFGRLWEGARPSVAGKMDDLVAKYGPDAVDAVGMDSLAAAAKSGDVAGAEQMLAYAAGEKYAKQAAARESAAALRFPDEGAESGYQAFRKLASRNSGYLDADAANAVDMLRRSDPAAENRLFPQASGGGEFGQTNDDILRSYQERFRREADLAPMSRVALPKLPEGPMSKPIPDAPEGFDPDAYVKEMVAKREAARVGKKEALMSQVDANLLETKKGLVDSNAPIEDLLTELQKKGNFQVLPKADISLQIDRAYRAPTLAGQFVRDNGLEDVVRNVDDIDGFEQYLIARQALDVASNGIETGRDLAKDKALVAAFGPRFEAETKAVKEYSDKLLDYAVDSGLVGKETAATLRAEYPHYVPINRIFAEGEEAAGKAVPGSSAVASLSKQSVVQKLKGSKREIESPLASFMAKTNDAFVQGERNKAGRLLAEYEKIGFPVRELKAGEKASDRTTFSYLDNGVKRTFVTTPEIAAAAHNWDQEQLNLLGKVLASFTRTFKMGTTGLNPSFIVSNLLRDQFTAIGNDTRSLFLKNPVKYAADLGRGLFEAVNQGELYQEAVRAGALGKSVDIYRDQAIKTVKQIRSHRSRITELAYMARNPSQLLRAAEDIIGVTEEATRLQQFKGNLDYLIKEGRTREDAILLAAKAARQNTTDFARRGTYGRVISSTFPYLNATIQGKRAFLRQLKQNPGGALLRATAVGAIPVASVTAWNLSSAERRAAYADIPEYEKETHLIILPPHPEKDEKGRWTGKGMIKLPMPQEIYAMTGPLRKVIEKSSGMDGPKFKDFVKSLIGTVSPIDVDIDQPERVLSNITPQMIKPAVEVRANMDFYTGAPIVPRKMENIPASEQYNEDTSEIAKLAGRTLGVSPMKVDHLIKGYTGGLGRIVSGRESVGESFDRRFTSAAGGAQEEGQWDSLNKALEQENLETYRRGQKAEAEAARLSRLPKEEANRQFNEIGRSDPAMGKLILKKTRESAVGIDAFDRTLKSLNVDNRAEFIIAELEKRFDTAEERNAYIQELIKKDVITEGVMAEMRRIRQAQMAQ